MKKNFDNSEFIHEKIIENPPEEKTLKKLLKLIISGCILGLAAAFTFLAAVSFFNNNMTKKDKVINITSSEKEETEGTSSKADEKISMDKAEFEKYVLNIINKNSTDSAASFYENIKLSAEDIKKSMFRVASIKKNKDWFDESYDSKEIQCGILVKKTDDKLYFLTGNVNGDNVDSIYIKLFSNEWKKAEFEKLDNALGVSVISLKCADIESSVLTNLEVIEAGGLYDIEAGDPVFAAGCPDGSDESIGIGFISSMIECHNIMDTLVTTINSSASVSDYGCSFLMDSKGKLIGIYPDTDKLKSSVQGYSSAYCFYDIKEYVERLCSGKDTAFIGLCCQNIEESSREDNDIPEGIFVYTVEKESAAYDAGIQAGDIISMIDGIKIQSVDDYVNALLKLDSGKKIKISAYRVSKDKYKEINFNVTTDSRLDK